MSTTNQSVISYTPKDDIDDIVSLMNKNPSTQTMAQPSYKLDLDFSPKTIEVSQ